MNDTVSLDQLPVGAQGVITAISANSPCRRRLYELGLVCGTQLQCVLRTSPHAPTAFLVRGTVLALRAADCRHITVHIVEQHTPAPQTYLLVGNPNVGKSTVFNALTGLQQHTGNWCGKTIAGAEGQCRFDPTVHLIDTPGTYSLLSQTAEECAARDVICLTPHDAILCICDATCLERGLVLALQLLEMHAHVVLCVNLLDEARKKRISVDFDRLSNRLHIPVIGITARKTKSIFPLLPAARTQTQAQPESESLLRYPQPIEKALAAVADIIKPHLPEHAMLSARWLALQLLRENTPLPDDVQTVLTQHIPNLHTIVADTRANLEAHGISPAELETVLAETAVGKAAELARETVSIPENASQTERRIDHLLLESIWRYPITICALLLIFWLTISAANLPSAWLASAFAWLCRAAHGLCDAVGCPAWLSGALIDGALHGTGWVVSVMLPPMAIFFPLFTLLEDSGLLPRFAYAADPCFANCKACGKQALTMAMSFGCNAVGVTECRIIHSSRERRIAVLTAAFVPCNGRFPTLLAIATIFSTHGSFASLQAAAILTGLVILSVGVSMGISWLLGSTWLRGEPSAFVLELPPYRCPQIGTVLLRSLMDRTLKVLGRAVIVAAPMSLVIWILANVQAESASLLTHISSALDPIGQAIGLDGVMFLAYILGFPANEIVLPVAVTAYLGNGVLTDYGSLDALHTLLTAHGWTMQTAISCLLFTLFHAPCATTLMTVYQETHSLRDTLIAWLLPTTVGLLLCGLVAQCFI